MKMNDMTYQMLCEMNDKAKKLVDMMKLGIVEFIYKKKSTGQRRKAHGTLKRDLIPVEAQRKSGRPKKRPEDLVIYFDTDKQAIRSFKDYLLQKIPSKIVDDKKKSIISKNDDDVNSSEKNSKQILKDKQHPSANKKPDKRKENIENED